MLLTGAPTIYEKVAESGAKREQAFCPRCGTAIYATSIGGDAASRIYSLRIGALRQRDSLVPKQQNWTRSRAHWLDGLRDLKGVEKQG